jgi:hypothetical protein
MKHVITLTTNELDVVMDVLAAAGNIIGVDEEIANDVLYRLDEQRQEELEENEAWGE